jgi:hypothetical protein
MKTVRYLILLILNVVSLSSCNKLLYIPNSHNVPLLEEKGDIKVGVTIKDLQVAYGITDHLGVMANAYYNKNDWAVSNGTSIFLDYNYKSTRSLFEGGLGYYSAVSDYGRFEVFGGAGFGHVNYDYYTIENGRRTQSNIFGADYTRFFLQPAVGMQGNLFGLAFSTRLTGVNFSSIDTTGYTPVELTEEGLNELEDNMFFFIEPALTFRVGVKYVQFQIQPYYNLQVAGPTSINAREFGCNVGVYLSIDELFKNKIE